MKAKRLNVPVLGTCRMTFALSIDNILLLSKQALRSKNHPLWKCTYDAPGSKEDDRSLGSMRRLQRSLVLLEPGCGSAHSHTCLRLAASLEYTISVTCIMAIIGRLTSNTLP